MNRPLYSFVRKRRCAQCWGPVDLREIDGEWEIYCPKNCEPGGHVSVDYVEMMEKQSLLDYAKAADNYPELDPFQFDEGDGSLFQKE